MSTEYESDIERPDLDAKAPFDQVGYVLKLWSLICYGRALPWISYCFYKQIQYFSSKLAVKLSKDIKNMFLLHNFSGIIGHIIFLCNKVSLNFGSVTLMNNFTARVRHRFSFGGCVSCYHKWWFWTLAQKPSYNITCSVPTNRCQLLNRNAYQRRSQDLIIQFSSFFCLLWLTFSAVES